MKKQARIDQLKRLLELKDEQIALIEKREREFYERTKTRQNLFLFVCGVIILITALVA